MIANPRVYVEQRMDVDALHAHVFSSNSEGTFYYRYDGDMWVAEKVPDGIRWPEKSSLHIPHLFAKQLVDALTDYAPPDKAQAKHLDDAIKVRDRLLTMLENG